MAREDIVYDQQYFSGGYGGYSDATAQPASQIEGVGAATAQRFVTKGFSIVGRNVLFLGAGLGKTVSYYRGQGVNAWGLELVQWAVDNTDAPGFVIQGDARVEADVDLAGAAAGVSSWDAVVTEQLIPCLSDAETLSALPMWRSKTQGVGGQVRWTGVVHIVHTHSTFEYNPTIDDYDEPYPTRSIAEWAALVDQVSSGNRSDWVWRWVDGGES